MRKIPAKLSSTLRTKVLYSESIANATTGAGGAILIRSGNNLTDVDGSGANPLLFSNYMAMYNQYKVYGSKMTVWITPIGSSVGNPFTVSLIPISANNTTPPSNAEAAINQPFNKTYRGVIGGQLTRPIKISNYISTKVLDNVKDLRDEDDYQGTATTGPSIEWAWYLFITNQTDPSAGTIGYNARINITYYVDFYDRVVPQVQ